MLINLSRPELITLMDECPEFRIRILDRLLAVESRTSVVPTHKTQEIYDYIFLTHFPAKEKIAAIKYLRQAVYDYGDVLMAEGVINDITIGGGVGGKHNLGLADAKNLIEKWFADWTTCA